jgi:hypothetical protein
MFKDLNRASRTHVYFCIFWAFMLVPTFLWWQSSIFWVAFISLYALVIGHWSSYEAANNHSVDKATHAKLNALAEGLADFMQSYADTHSDEKLKQTMVKDIKKLKATVGLEDRDSE